MNFIRALGFYIIALLVGVAGMLALLHLQSSSIKIERQYQISNTQKSTSLEMPSFDPPIGVMIENHSLSRAFQKGLSRARVVYEAPAEGGITRFFALFVAGEYDGKLGPVRSARSYFIDWASEYKSLYAHVGGHTTALSRLQKEDGVHNVDQFIYEDFFWREHVGETALEHTMFTTGEKLLQLIHDENWIGESRPYLLAKRKTGGDFSLYPEAKSIDVDFSYASYVVHYSYDNTLGKYLRSNGGKAHIDTVDGTQIAPDIVIVQRIKAWVIDEEKGALGMQTVGSGDAYIFVSGRKIDGSWKKESIDRPTRFYDLSGTLVPLPEGQIWIEVVPEYADFSSQ